MSSTNKTANLELNQWVGTDPFCMADFNADNVKLDAVISALPRIAAGYYVGTGVYGSNAPNALTFDFVPKLLYISRRYAWITDRNSGDTTYGDTNRHALLPYTAMVDEYAAQGTTFHANFKFCVDVGDGSSVECLYALSNEGRTMTWYSSSSAANQLNTEDTFYYYIAIG